MTKHYFFLLWLCLPFWATSQNIETIGGLKDIKPFEFSGSISASAYMIQSNRSNSFQQRPFGYYLSGNVNLKLYSINFPISLTYSDRNFNYNYNLPSFYRFGMSPYYKWIKVHGGWRNMNFSKYTYNGLTFLGGGIELTPKNFRFSAMYGRLESRWNRFDALRTLPIEEETELPERWGYGMKIGYGKSRNFIDLILFGAKDRAADANLTTLNNLNIVLGENLAIGTKFKVTIFKKVSLQGDWATSMLTSNLTAPEMGQDSTMNFGLRSADRIINVNRSTRSFLAGDIKLSIRLKGINLGLKYQRVEPYYSSYGLYFVRNDFENYTGNLSVSFWKRKLYLSGTYGYQRNNLSNHATKTSYRTIYSGNLSFNPHKQISLSANYSNYASDQKSTLVEFNDTLRIASVNTSGSLTPRLKFGTDIRQSVSISFGFSEFKSLTQQLENSENLSRRASINYSANIKDSGFRFRSGLTMNYNRFREQENYRYGLRMSVSRPFLEKKLNASLNSSWQKSQFERKEDGFVLSNGLNIRYKIGDKQSVSLSNHLLLRKTKVQRSFNSWRGNLAYSMSF